jgi:hypothetical protein
MKTAEPRTVTPAIQRKAAGPFFRRGGNSFLDQDSISKQDSFFPGKSARTPSVNSPGIQAKLTVGKPDDKYEKEADAMADKVVQRLSVPDISANEIPGILAKPLAVGITPLLHRKCTHCEGEQKTQGEEKDAGKDKLQRKPIFESNAEPPEDESIVQRKCAHCEEEKDAEEEKGAGDIKMQKKEEGGGSSSASPDIESKLNSSSGRGSSLPESTRGEMENSFCANFSRVKIHTDSSAVDMSKNLNAQAFTHGNDIYFNAGKYDTSSVSGKHLLAHELTHTIQQGGSKTDSINRSVNDNSTCDPNVDTAAPPSPLIFIILSDAMASMHLTSARLALSLDLMGTTGAPAGSGFDAYRRRFGDPAAVRNKFRNRFNSSLHDTIGEAQASEMRSLIGIFDRIGAVLARDINYRCIGPNVRTIGGTRFDCATTGFSLISTNGVNRIIICPNFWGLSPDQRGVGIIHEAVHILFPFGDHDVTPAQSSDQRRTEPECYASLAADVNGVQIFDNSCPPV